MPLTEEEKRQKNIARCYSYRQTHLEERRAKERQYGREHRERDWRTHQRLKREVLSYYSGGEDPHCVSCGEKRLDCLSIDHINNNGYKEKKETNKFNHGIYQFLKTKGYPEGYQTLCMNCQFIKRQKLYRERLLSKRLTLIIMK